MSLVQLFHFFTLFSVKDCGQQYRIPNGKYVYKRGTLFGDKIVYGCKNGYEYSGHNESVCQADGQWSSQPGSCNRKNPISSIFFYRMSLGLLELLTKCNKKLFSMITSSVTNTTKMNLSTSESCVLCWPQISNKDSIDHSFFLEPNFWSQLLQLALGLPIWLPKKLYWLDSLLTIVARLFSLVLIIHQHSNNHQREKAQPSVIFMYCIELVLPIWLPIDFI